MLSNTTVADTFILELRRVISPVLIKKQSLKSLLLKDENEMSKHNSIVAVSLRSREPEFV